MNNLLLSFPGYKKFLDFNHIKYDIAKQAVPSYKYLKINKGEYIFKEGDISNKFYFVLKGKISLRKKFDCNKGILSKHFFVI